MVKVLFLLSGGYGAGKTFFAHQMVGAGNTVALAAPIRSDLFKVFLDTKIHSTSQDVKNEFIDYNVLTKTLKKPTISKVSKPLWDKFYELMSEKDLHSVTYRDILKGWGDAGRALNKNYWINRTIKLLEEFNSNLIAVDDVRFINERDKLCKWAEKRGFDVHHYFVGHADDCYDNIDLALQADYNIFWR